MIATPYSTSTGRLSWDLLWWLLGREQRGRRRTFKGEGAVETTGEEVAYSPFCILGRCAGHGTLRAVQLQNWLWCHLRWGSEQERRPHTGMVRIRIHQAPPKSPRLDWKTFWGSLWFPIRLQTMVREGSGLPIEESALWNHEPACWGWGRKQLCLHRLNSRKACKGRCLAEGLQACDMPHIYMWTKVACGRGSGLDTTCVSDHIRGYSRPKPTLT